MLCRNIIAIDSSFILVGVLIAAGHAAWASTLRRSLLTIGLPVFPQRRRCDRTRKAEARFNAMIWSRCDEGETKTR